MALPTRKREPRQAREGATVARKSVAGPFLFPPKWDSSGALREFPVLTASGVCGNAASPKVYVRPTPARIFTKLPSAGLCCGRRPRAQSAPPRDERRLDMRITVRTQHFEALAPKKGRATRTNALECLRDPRLSTIESSGAASSGGKATPAHGQEHSRYLV